MHLNIIARVLGLLLMIFSLTMLPPILVAVLYGENTSSTFAIAFGITLAVGLAFWLPSKQVNADMRTRDGFLITVCFWLVLSTFGALPLMLAEAPNLSFINALFESVSGLTTTGATVISGLDDLPKSILYYRQQLQWLGGIGIVVIAVAILPMLGVGGMQLYRTETPGPMKDSKLTPRIRETANVLFKIYLGLTAVCALAYWMAGMSGFDAISHSFSTMPVSAFLIARPLWPSAPSLWLFRESTSPCISMSGTIVKSLTTGQILKRACISIYCSAACRSLVCTSITAAPTVGARVSARVAFTSSRL